ncbi:hypothetical protein [Calycomorphotria hydatis]|uniref:Uncharacterized protein n=1 Tax=Calycomorphotria hydatis TaxID=2528027 RepID=A0A517T955_9PLAN|nr:hypothetical protein [Calycomorphotria hydatis]QDT64915.1 hypothetical protein V22_21600 [Calycomorphotria hydatis]
MEGCLQRIARQLTDYEDARQAVVNLREDCIRCLGDLNPPARFQSEIGSLLKELDEVKPSFPSQPRSSILYDREGLGKVGRDRAKRIVTRIEALSRDLANLNG